MNDGQAAASLTKYNSGKRKKVRFAMLVEQSSTRAPSFVATEKVVVNVERVICGVTITDMQVGTGLTA